MRTTSFRTVSPFAAIAALTATLLLSLSLCLLNQAAPAFAAGADSNAENSIILCVERSKAKGLALELGVSSKQAALAQSNPDAAEGTIAKAADSCTWEVLMDVSAKAVENSQVVDDNAADDLDDSGYLIVSVASRTSSVKELLAWAKKADGVLFAEAQTGTQTEQAAGSLDDSSDADDDDSAKGTFTNYFSTTPTLNEMSSYQWFLKNTGAFADGKAGFDLNAKAGVHSSAEQVVAIIDGGVDYNNPALVPYMVNLEEYPELMAQTGANKYGFCGLSNHERSDCMDENGHGTHCAGIVTQVATEGGTAGSIRIMAVRAGDATGFFESASTIRCYEFVAKAREAGVNVVAANASFGGAGYTSLAERVALNQMIQSGVPVAMAAGNDGSFIDGAPTSQGAVSSTDGLLIVGASDTMGNPASFSDFGKQTVNVFAPGSTIISTVNEKEAEFTGVIAAQNTRDNVTDAPRALIYESFEEGDADASIGGGLQFSYATCEESYDDGEERYIFHTNDTPLKYAQSSLLGKRSLVLAQSEDTACLVSNVIDPALATKLEMLDLSFIATGKNALLDYGFLDEEGTWYSCMDYERIGVEGVWINLGVQAKQALLKTVQDAMVAGTHQFRLILKAASCESPIRVDSIALGYGVSGCGFKQGTSMATPMVTGLLALAAAAHPEASPREQCAYVLGGSEKASNLLEKCSTSGNATIAGMDNPAPVINSASANHGVLSIEGYFFGEKTGTVQVGGTTAQVLSWQRSSGNAYAVRAALPSKAKSGYNELIVTSALGASGRTVKDLGNLSWNYQYQDLPTLPNSFGDTGNATMASTTKYIYSFMTGGSETEDLTNLRIYRYAKGSGTWSKLGTFDLAKLAGTSFALNSRGTTKIINANGTVYATIGLEAADSDAHDYFKSILFRFDPTAKKLGKVLTSKSELSTLFSYGSKLFLTSTANVSKAGKASNKALAGWKAGDYLLVQQVNTKTGKLTFKGAANLKNMGKGSAYIADDPKFIGIVNHRIVMYYVDDEKHYVLSCKMSAITSKSAVFSRSKAPYSTDAFASIDTIGGSLVISGVVFTRGVPQIWTFNPKSKVWANTNLMYSTVEASSVACASGPEGSTVLYVCGEEDATTNLRVKFMRAINLKGLVASIDPSRPTSVKVTKATKTSKRSIKVSWAKASGATRYQICYSTTKGMKYKAYTTTKSLKKTIKKLKKGKRYYVKVRAYRVTNGTNLYSEWSAKRSVKL